MVSQHSPSRGEHVGDALSALVRPILETVQLVTGLESTYLTSIDPAAARETVLLARNAGSMHIAEGVHVPWSAAARRHVPENGAVGTDGPGGWPDAATARALGIRTCVSRPVRAPGGRPYGMLGGASTRSVDVGDEAWRVLDMAARLIGLHLERDHLVADLQRARAELAASALTGAVTGLPNRGALVQELGRMLARAQRDDMAVFAALIGVDGLTPGGDPQRGADAVLRAMADRLTAGLRGGDLVARSGSDGFVVVGTVPRETAEASADVVRERLRAQIAGGEAPSGRPVAPAVASIGLVVARVGEFEAEALLARAEAAMHEARCIR